MKKRSYLALMLTGLALLGCVKEPDSFQDKDGIVFDLVLEDIQTKATKPGIAAWNENAIPDFIDIFFYNESTGEITKDVIEARQVGSRVSLQTNPNDIEQIFGTIASGAHCGVFIVANFTGTYSGETTQAGKRCLVAGTTLADIKATLLPAPNWETFPQSSFVMTGEKQITLGNAQGSTPVNETVRLSRVAARVTFDVTVAENASGTDSDWTPVTADGAMSVYLVYAMRKATLSAEPVPVPATKDVTYNIGGVSAGTVVYNQYVDKLLYDTGTKKTRTRGTGNDEHEEQASVFSLIPGAYDESNPYNGDLTPFYTYPVSWDTGSSMEPYLKLIIPWDYHGNIKKYYYKIPFAGNALERNHWYHISIDVRILGTEQADPPQVEVHYAIADWSGEIDDATAEEITNITSVPAQVIVARFLNIPTTEYVLYDRDHLTIPMMSSHDVEIVGFQVSSSAYQPAHEADDNNYVGENPRIYNPFTTTLAASDRVVAVRPDYSNTTITSVSRTFPVDETSDANGWRLIIKGRDSISFHHPLNRDMTSNAYDVAPYTIRFRVRHTENQSSYFTDVTIEQRPSIIIRPELNSGGKSNYGYVYVNGAHANGNNNNNADGSYTSDTRRDINNTWRFYLGVAGTNLENSGNVNENMFIIETSVLPTTGGISEYVLGDPRSRTVDNLTANYEWRKEGPSVTGGANRRLTYYYPAGDSAYDDFIAPKIRFASSFAATQTVTYANAKRRCASYQEDGYPAGRWRLPTVAEVTYIATLNADGKIVRLLGNNSRSQGNTSDYWCNSGYITVYNGANTDYSGGRIPKPVPGTSFSDSDSKSVRCVYDEWYWEGTKYDKLANKTVFTWGDQNREDVRMK